MNKGIYRLTLDQPARYRIVVAGHLDRKRVTWFEGLALVNGYSDDHAPFTTITGEVLDQAMLHGLLIRIRDLGLPLISVTRLECCQARTTAEEGDT